VWLVVRDKKYEHPAVDARAQQQRKSPHTIRLHMIFDTPAPLPTKKKGEKHAGSSYIRFSWQEQLLRWL
jgi:hypothetical protein